MNCKNLMIGDWVINPVHNDKCKIHGVYFDKELNCIVATDGRFPQEYFSPIPITPEILEANGFKKIPDYEDSFEEFEDIEGYNWRVNDHDSPLQLYTFLRGDKICEVFGGVRIYYVHELQHALRLCGLGELADNFKVE